MPLMARGEGDQLLFAGQGTPVLHPSLSSHRPEVGPFIISIYGERNRLRKAEWLPRSHK